MSSRNNRRLRALHHRHERAKKRLTDRISGLRARGASEQELKAAQHTLDAMIVEHAAAVRHKPESGVATAPRRPASSAAPRRLSLDLGPTSPVLEKQGPKVHGVNAQREDRRRPQVGGARGSRPVA